MSRTGAAMKEGGPARVIALAACALTATIAVARLVLAIADPESSAPITDPRVPGGGLAVAAFEAAALSALGVVGTIIVLRRPRNPIGWIMFTIPISFGLLILGRRLFWSFELAEPGGTAAELAAWLSSWCWIPAIFAAMVFFPLLFPTGAPPSPRWRPVAWLAAFGCVGMVVGEAFRPGRFEDLPATNPLGLEAELGSVVEVVFGGLGFLLLICCALAALVSAVVRFRRSRGVERQQLKWVVGAAALLPVVQAVPSGDLGFASLVFGLLVIGVAVAIAMLRYRLYDIDVVINRTLVYGALTAMLAVVYLGSVLLLQLALSGVTEGSGPAVAASTLGVAALFRPARARIQEGVDRRFFRRRYDAQHTLEAFSARLRDEVDLGRLDAELSSVVRETLQPAHVSLWLRTPEAER